MTSDPSSANRAELVRDVAEAIRFAEEYGYREWLAAQGAFAELLRRHDQDKHKLDHALGGLKHAFAECRCPR